MSYQLLLMFVMFLHYFQVNSCQWSQIQFSTITPKCLACFEKESESCCRGSSECVITIVRGQIPTHKGLSVMRRSMVTSIVVVGRVASGPTVTKNTLFIIWLEMFQKKAWLCLKYNDHTCFSQTLINCKYFFKRSSNFHVSYCTKQRSVDRCKRFLLCIHMQASSYTKLYLCSDTKLFWHLIDTCDNDYLVAPSPAFTSATVCCNKEKWFITVISLFHTECSALSLLLNVLKSNCIFDWGNAIAWENACHITQSHIYEPAVIVASCINKEMSRTLIADWLLHPT